MKKSVIFLGFISLGLFSCQEGNLSKRNFSTELMDPSSSSIGSVIPAFDGEKYLNSYSRIFDKGDFYRRGLVVFDLNRSLERFQSEEEYPLADTNEEFEKFKVVLKHLIDSLNKYKDSVGLKLKSLKEEKDAKISIANTSGGIKSCQSSKHFSFI